ncbi:MAG: hypothetical protein HZB68_03440 [Candidatus Aenigmarchaeota archaeon]|nr:hypothetical protein [Candidatus Aenigmarchaeota archaeon]
MRNSSLLFAAVILVSIPLIASLAEAHAGLQQSCSYTHPPRGCSNQRPIISCYGYYIICHDYSNCNDGTASTTNACANADTSSSYCSYSTCPAGFADANNNPSDGCETNLCNNNGVCDSYENAATCPNDCSPYTATFYQTGVAPGIVWSVSVGGTSYNSASSKITATVTGTKGYSYVTPTNDISGTRYSCTSGCTGAVSKASPSVNASYKSQYRLDVSAIPPSGGSVSPTAGSYWHDPEAGVLISASPSSNYVFDSWDGSGTGSYGGPLNSTSITMGSAITETASFSDVTWKQCGSLRIGEPEDAKAGATSLKTISGKQIQVDIEINATLCPPINVEVFLKKLPPSDWDYQFDCSQCIVSKGKTVTLPSNNISKTQVIHLFLNVPSHASTGSYKISVAGRKA